MSRRTPIAIPEPYQDVKSLRASVMALKEVVENITGQRGNDGDNMVSADDLNDALGTGIGSKVSKKGDTMTGNLVVNGTISATSLISTSTRVTCSDGFMCKAGSGGATNNAFNINWTGVPNLWIDTTNIGQFAFTSDYRLKKDVKTLPSVWNTVKLLRPIRYTPADFGELFKASDEEQWGFIAHELQRTLIASAASGYKDAPDLVQSPNPWTLLAALTKTLQEAMTRIEALEAKLG